MTFAASSGVTSLTSWSCAACVVTFFTSSSSVGALAVKAQPSTTSPQAMCLVISLPFRRIGRRIFDEIELNLLTFFEEMHTRRELVTAFIAVLEIVRTDHVKLVQKKTFGDIFLKKVDAAELEPAGS